MPKRARKKITSSGKRVIARTEKQLGRRSNPIGDPAVRSFLKSQKRDLWPSNEVSDKYASLNAKKHQAGPARKRPEPLGFPLMEAAMATSLPALKKLLVAASLKVKRVRRHPGWVLNRTYNLKGAPITII